VPIKRSTAHFSVSWEDGTIEINEVKCDSGEDDARVIIKDAAIRPDPFVFRAETDQPGHRNHGEAMKTRYIS
jgi:hypothetical protein